MTRRGVGGQVFVCTDNSDSRERPNCPCGELHHPGAPSGYVQWFAWAERMTVTHRQEQCPGCGRWAIYVQREPGATICPTCHRDRTAPSCVEDCGSTQAPEPWEVVRQWYVVEGEWLP